MSGIYLICWDDKDRDESLVLKPTKGGYPHITLAYTGKHATPDQLAVAAAKILREWRLREITIIGAYVNSFKKDDGTMRHDVLMRIAEADAVADARNVYIRSQFANSGQFFMIEPHITHAIYETQEQAERACEILNQSAFPYKVTVTGVTIN